MEINVVTLHKVVEAFHNQSKRQSSAKGECATGSFLDGQFMSQIVFKG